MILDLIGFFFLICVAWVVGSYVLAGVAAIFTPNSWKKACTEHKKEMAKRMQGPHAHGMDRPEDNHLY
jgi:hypothetical protein